MSSAGAHLRALTAEMEQSAQAGDLTKLQSQLARWEAGVPDENVTREEHLGIDISIAEIDDCAEMRDRTDMSKPVYELLTRLLIKAAEGNQVATVKYIIDKRGVPITPIIAKKAINSDAFNVLEVFLENGWNINDPIQANFCPILAFVTHNERRTRWCLEHGADPNARNKSRNKDVPSYAGSFASVSTLRLLAAHGANFPGSNALQRAAEGGMKGRIECLQWLLDEAGFPIDQYEFGWDPAVFENWRIGLLGTALHLAIYANSPERVQFLLERGSDINLQDTYGRAARELPHGRRKEEVLAILDGWGKQLTGF